MVGEERERPYERPPLSKDYLLGKAERETVYVHPQQWYAEHQVDLRLGVDGHRHRSQRARGEPRRWQQDRLRQAAAGHRILTAPPSGAGRRPRRRALPANRRRQRPDQGGPPVCLPGRGDRRGLDRPGGRGRGPGRRRGRDRAGNGRTAVAAGARPRGRPGLRRPCTGARRGPALRRPGRRDHRQRRAGPTECGWPTAAASRPTRSSSGSGSRPTASWPQAAGLEVSNGIVVDAQLRSSDPDIYAAGDVANAFHPLLGKHIRVEHWANALHQPQTAASGDARPGRRLRPGALLLHRPVRPGHGVLRLRRTGRLRPGRLPRRRRPARVHRLLAERRPACWPA